MSLIKIATIFNIDLEFEIAEIQKRIFAYLIDFIILVLYFTSMKYLYYGGVSSDTAVLKSRMGLDIITISFPMLVYSLVTEIAMHGQTVGKKLLNIRVLSLDGGEPSLSQYLLRWIFRAFEWPFFFGYVVFTGETIFSYATVTAFLGIVVVIIIAISKKNQRLGDFAANTVVVNTVSLFSVNDTVFMEIDNENYKVKFPEVLRLSDRDINTIKNIINLFHRENNTETCNRVALKVEEVLNIKTDMYAIDFLEKLLADYNYLATR
ncbi:MAG: RDD family protein [Ginsengibacter sp.]